MPIAYNLGPGTTIIQVLRHYKKVPFEFLIDKAGQDADEVEEYLKLLEQEGAVRRYPDGMVELVPEK